MYKFGKSSNQKSASSILFSFAGSALSTTSLWSACYDEIADMLCFAAWYSLMVPSRGTTFLFFFAEIILELCLSKYNVLPFFSISHSHVSDNRDRNLQDLYGNLFNASSHSSVARMACGLASSAASVNLCSLA